MLSIREILDKLPASQRWRLFIDGYRQDEGRMGFDVKEQGYMAAMENAFEAMIGSISEPLKAETIIALHRYALGGVENTDNEHLDTFRNGLPGDFGLLSNEDAETPKKGNVSREGLLEFLQSESFQETVIHKSGQLVPKYEIELGGKDISRDHSAEEIYELIKTGCTRFYVARQSAEAINQYVNQRLEIYHQELKQARNPNEKLNAIIKMVSTLERAHIFTDGNARTMVMLVLNRELLKNGFTPVILENPNRFDLFSGDELRNEVIKGMQHYWHYANKEEILQLLSDKGLDADLSDPFPSPIDSGYASPSASPQITRSAKMSLQALKEAPQKLDNAEASSQLTSEDRESDQNGYTIN